MRSLTNLRLETSLGSWWFVAILVLMVASGLTAVTLLYTQGLAQAQNSPPSTKSITLSWADPGGGVGYQFSTDHGVTWEDVSFNGDSSFGHTISSPAHGAATVFLLRATGAGHRVVNPTPPRAAAQQAGTSSASAPSLAAQSTGAQTVTLVWTAPTQGAGTPVTLYEVDWSPDGRGSSWRQLARVNPSSGTSYDDNEVHIGDTRHYRVRAVDASFNYGPWSRSVSATVTEPIPNTPVLVALPTVPGEIRLTWTEPEGARQGSDVARYNLEWSPDGSDSSWDALTDIHYPERRESYEDSIAYGTTRYYRIRAVDSSGDASPWSRVVSATATFPPHKPFLDGVVAGRDSIHLEWIVPHGGASISRQEIRVSSDGGAIYRTVNARLEASAVSHTFAGLQSGASLIYGVRACNSETCSEWATTPELTVGQNPVPTSPGLKAEVISSAEIELTWTQPDDGGSDITAYELQGSRDGIEWESSDEYEPDRKRLLIQDLDGGTTVHFRARARNGNGAGLWSEVVAPTTITGAPSAPTELTATAAGDHQIDLTWKEPVSRGGGNSVIRYRVERFDMSASGDWDDRWELVTTTTELTHSDTGLYEGTWYYYRVAAVNGAGRGPWENPVSATTTGTPPATPTRPTLVRFASLGVNQATIAWDAPESDGGRPVTGYQLAVSSQCSNYETSVHETTGMRVEIANLPECADGYNFGVRAVNAIGEGDWWPGLFGRVPTSSSGRVIVAPTSLRISEGGSSSFTVKLGQAPTKDLDIIFFWEGDNDLFDSVWDFGNDFTFTRENWAEGLTFQLNLAEDDDAVNGTAVLHINLHTKDDRSNSERRANPKPPEPVFDGQAGAAILAVEVDND